MILFGLLAVPLIIGLVGLIFGKGFITWREFICQEAVVIVLILSAYFAGRQYQMSSTEIWSGRIAQKGKDSVHCCHSYECNCTTDSKGNRSCQTCYEHFSDVEWFAKTTNNETVYSNSCNPPYSSAPSRWEQIVVGEPTAVEHSYDNYLKAVDSTVLIRKGVAQKFPGALPGYPDVYDHYRVRRVLTVGANVPDVVGLNKKLDEMNADLGRAKQVNMMLIVTNQPDQFYVEGLREHWKGGEKNDLVVVIGAPDFPKIAWADVMSWTDAEEVKLGIRNKILELGTFDGNAVLDIVKVEVSTKFVRKQMKDFEYLKASIEPPSWILWLTFFLSVAASIGMGIYFYRNDLFQTDRFARRISNSRTDDLYGIHTFGRVGGYRHRDPFESNNVFKLTRRPGRRF